MKTMKALIIGGVVLFLAFILFLASATSVPSGHTGVVSVMGKVSDETLDAGFHFKTPFASVTDISNKIQKIDVEAGSTSKDMQTVNSSVSINFHLAVESTVSMYKNIGENYTDTLIQPAVQEAVKSVMAKYSAEELITMRSQVGIEISEELTKKLSSYGIVIDQFNITNFNFTAEFNAAIEAKQVAEQNLIKAQTENEQKILAAEAAASEKTIAAQAQADEQRILAEAEAEAIRIKAEAEAEANKKISESVDQNVLTYNQIEQWNGEYPAVMSGDSGTSLLIDVESVTSGN